MSLSKLRDIISILVGAFGLVHSQLTGNIYPELVAVYTALLGTPIAARMIENRKNKNGGKGPPNDSSSE